MKHLLTAILLAAAVVMPAMAQTRDGDTDLNVKSASYCGAGLSCPDAWDQAVRPDIRHYGISDGDVLRGGDTHLRTSRYLAHFSLREAELGGPG